MFCLISIAPKFRSWNWGEPNGFLQRSAAQYRSSWVEQFQGWNPGCSPHPGGVNQNTAHPALFLSICSTFVFCHPFPGFAQLDSLGWLLELLRGHPVITEQLFSIAAAGSSRRCRWHDHGHRYVPPPAPFNPRYLGPSGIGSCGFRSRRLFQFTPKTGLPRLGEELACLAKHPNQTNCHASLA